MKYINFEEDNSDQTDMFFMKEALKEANIALALDEIPIGAVVVHGNRIIGKGHNMTETLHDVTAHAEMQAFTAAANFIGGKYLLDCTLYVTIEPCIMCAGAAYWSQIKRLVYGALDEKRGFHKVGSPILHPRTSVYSGVLEAECSNLLKQFFQHKRKQS